MRRTLCFADFPRYAVSCAACPYQLVRGVPPITSVMLRLVSARRLAAENLSDQFRK